MAPAAGLMVTKSALPSPLKSLKKLRLLAKVIEANIETHRLNPAPLLSPTLMAPAAGLIVTQSALPSPLMSLANATVDTKVVEANIEKNTDVAVFIIGLLVNVS